MSDSPEGQPDFRLQQYLVATMPHCTRCSQICIDHNDNSSSTLLTITEDVVFMVSETKFSIDLKQEHVEVTGPQPVKGCLPVFVWCLGPMGAFSKVGQAEWEGRIRS